MTPTAEDRNALFKAFGRAWFKRDVAALYEVVTEDFVWRSLDDQGGTRAITGRDAVGEALTNHSGRLENVRFEDVVYHHASEATFMTFRLTATVSGTGAAHEENGVERYTFREGRIAVKDVYRKSA